MFCVCFRINICMAQLNPYIADNGNVVPIPNRPIDQYDPTFIARITPRESRGYAFAAYQIWFTSGMAAPWDGIYTDHEGPQNLNYAN